MQRLLHPIMRRYIFLLSIGVILIRFHSSSTTRKADLLQSFNDLDQNRLLRVNDDSREGGGLDQYLDPKVVEPREQNLISPSSYTNLQSLPDIDPTIEINAKQNATNKQCDRLFIYLPDTFAKHGHGSQLNAYIMSIVTSTYLNRSLLLLEPDDIYNNRYPGGSQFGCPIEEDGGGNSFPMGLSRLIDHPTFLSNGCSIPTSCSYTPNPKIYLSNGRKSYSYYDWDKIVSTMSNSGKGFDELTCTNVDGSKTNVVISNGWQLRKYFRKHHGTMSSGTVFNPMKAREWILNLGATLNEAELFVSIQDNSRKLWDYLFGILNKAGFLKFQPWIGNDVQKLLSNFELPLLDEEEYTAIHVRRGDKLLAESRGEVESYWRMQLGFDADMNALPTNYIPFIHYLRQWDSSDSSCTMNDETGMIEIQKHNVYIATDDPITVRREIAELDTQHLTDNTILWNDCHELTFYFNPNTVSTVNGEEEDVMPMAFHLNGDGEDGFDQNLRMGTKVEDTCHDRYQRSIASVTDLMILARAHTFIGEYNSNWGSIIHAVRVRLNENRPIPGDTNPDTLASIKQNNLLTYGSDSFTRTLDMRIAFGPTEAISYEW